jgi:histidine triad (HIT) family protein
MESDTSLTRNEVGMANENDKGIFEKIIDREIPAEIVYEDDDFLAFKDIAPKAPVHLLVIPKKPSPRLDAMLEAQGAGDIGALLEAAVKTARANGLGDYRLVVNVGPGAGQEVFHTHVHIMAGWDTPSALGQEFSA